MIVLASFLNLQIASVTYKTVYSSATVKSENPDAFNAMFSCTPVVTRGESYSINDITCSYNILPLFNKDNLGKEQDSVFTIIGNTAHFTGLSTLVYTKKTEVGSQPYEWYMIRNGYLGPEYTSKIVSAILSIILIVYDCVTRKRIDYLTTFIFGTILWIILEFVLLETGVREYQVGYIRGKELGYWPALIIRCMQECGFLMVVALFDGDRLCDCMKGKQSRPSTCRNMIELAVVFIFLTASSVMNMLSGWKEFRAVGSPDVAGRRNMTHPASVGLFCGMTVICIIFVCVYHNKKYFVRRTLGQTIFITWVTGSGMLIEYIGNARWVEVGHYPEHIGMPSSGHEFLAMMYDLIIEVIIPPLFIYFLMVLLRLLPDLKSDTYYDEEKASKKKKELPITDKPVQVPTSVVQNAPLPAIEL